MRDELVTDISAFERDELMPTLHAAWAPFAAAVATRRGPFHTPSAATIGDGAVARVRTVVLRGCEISNWTLRFHTDRRSAKFSELTANPSIALHVYSQPAKLQVRLEGRARLHCDDAFAEDAWASSRPTSRECYTQPSPPGLSLAAPEPDRAPLSRSAQELHTGRENFCAVHVEVHTLEWLYLRAAGHRRARFTREAGRAAEITATWLAP